MYVSSRLFGTIATIPEAASACACSRKAVSNRPVPAPCTNTTPGLGSSSPTGSLIWASTVAPSSWTVTTDVRTSYSGTGAAEPIAVDDVSTTSGSASGTGSHCGPMTAPRTARSTTPRAVLAATR